MREETDEAKKVIRNEGQIWHAVFRKKDFKNDSNVKQEVDNKILTFY
jgi:hypothetical protein